MQPNRKNSPKRTNGIPTHSNKEIRQRLTIVVEERDDYIKNAMTHLNDPLSIQTSSRRHIPNTQTIIEKLKMAI